MPRLIARWIAAVRRFFQKRPEPPPLPLLLLSAPRRKCALETPPVIYAGAPPEVTDDMKFLWVHRHRKGWVASAEGRFYFKDDVLDQLDYYFQAIRRFKTARRDFYDLVSQTGINLIPDRAVYLSDDDDDGVFPEIEQVEPWFAQTLPAFGAYCFGTLKKVRESETKKQIMHSRFTYFTRFAKKGVPITVQPVKEGTVYVMGIYFDNTGIKSPKKVPNQKPGVVELPVMVAHDGTVTALKVLEPKRLSFPHKNKHRSHDWATRGEWGFPDALIDFAKQHKTTPEKYLCTRFALAAREHTKLNSSMIRVRIQKHDLSAVMNVDMERTPYFFKDRQPVFVDGIKKKIFHIVRPHERINGNVSTDVHMHFRGLRRFSWNGYDVAITVPGWDHSNWAMADIAAYDEDSKGGRKIKRFLHMQEIGKMAAKEMTVPHLGATS